MDVSLKLSKPTGGKASGSVGLTFKSSNIDETHVRNESESKSEDKFDDRYGSTEKYNSESKSKYNLDDVFRSKSNGGINVSLNADGSTTPSGSVSYDEKYTFDQLSQSEDKSSEETTPLGRTSTRTIRTKARRPRW